MKITPKPQHCRDGRKFAAKWLKGLSEATQEYLSSHDRGALSTAFANALLRAELGLDPHDELPDQETA